MVVDHSDLVDGTILESLAGHRVMIDGMAGPFIKVVDAGGRAPLPNPGWLAIGPQALADHINEGRWIEVDR